MTRSPSNLPTSSRLRFVRRTGVLVAAAVAATLVAVDPAVTEAAPMLRTSSAAIAATADRAGDAYDRWIDTGAPADYVRFVQARDTVAELTATDLAIDADELAGEWAAADHDNQRTVLAAMSQLGVPYRSMASEEGVGFDCSGLLIWAFDQVDVELPRSSGDQIAAAVARESDDAQPGDLVYYPGHISIYLGAEVMVHSPNSGNHVEARPIPTTRTLRWGDALNG